MVLFAHFVAPRLGKEAGAFRAFALRGGAGVDLFFILSGFILMYVYVGASGGATIDRRAFWTARFARVYPVFALALALDLVPSILYARHIHQSFSPVYLAAFAATKVTLLTSWYPPFVKSPSYVNMGWTLSVEAFFYLLFPFIVRPFLRLSPRALLAFVLLCALASWGVRNGVVALWERAPAMHVGDTVANEWFLHVPPFRFPDFLMGVALGRLFSLRRAQDLPPAEPILLPASFLLAIGLLAFTPLSLDANAWPYMVLDLALAGVIFGLAEATGLVRDLLSRSLPVLLGEASYSMYLLHGLVFVVVRKTLAVAGQETFLDKPLAAALLILATILVSIPVYRFVEGPARQWIRTASMRHSPKRAE